MGEYAVILLYYSSIRVILLFVYYFQKKGVFFMINLNNYNYFFIILIFFLILGNVSAIDNNRTDFDSNSKINDVILSSEDINYNNSNDVLSLNSDVNNTQCLKSSDEEILNVDDSGSFSDLYDLIKGTDKGEILVLDKNFKFNSDFDSKYQNGINIEKDIKIDGRGKIIDGNNLANIFNIVGDKVLLRNLSIINSPKAITVSGDNITLSHIVFTDTNNTITWYSNNALIESCTFNNNKGSQPLINVQGTRNPKITDCIFNRCNVTYNCIILVSYVYNSNISFCKFNYCESPNQVIYGTMTSTNIYDCDFINNTRLARIVYINKGYLNLFNSNFINNFKRTNADTVVRVENARSTIYNCDFIDNQNVYYGTIYLGELSTVDSCNFINSSSRNVYAGIYFSKSGSKVINSNFTNITASRLFYVWTINRISFSNCNIKNNVMATQILELSPANIKFSFIGGEISNNIISAADNALFNLRSADTEFNLNTTIKDNKNMSGGAVLNYTSKYNIVPFKLYDNLYVTNQSTPTGDGSGKDLYNLMTVNEALDKIAPNGTIHLAPGNFRTSNYNQLSGLFYIKGSGTDKTTVYSGKTMLPLGLSDFTYDGAGGNNERDFFVYENIIFTNKDPLPQSNNFKVTFRHCTFNVYPNNACLRIVSGCEITVEDITCLNCYAGCVIAIEGASAYNNVIKDIYVYGSHNLNRPIISVHNSAVQISNIHLYNSDLSGLGSNKNAQTGNLGLLYCGGSKDTVVDGIYVENVTSNGPIVFANAGMKISNIFMNNITQIQNKGSLIGVQDGVKIENVSLNNVKYYNILGKHTRTESSSGGWHTVYGSLEPISNMKLTNLTISNSNCNHILTLGENNILNKLDFSNVNVTDIMFNLSKSNLINSEFDNFMGNIHVVGDNVKISGSLFKNGCNNTVGGVGSAVVLMGGNDFLIESCTFINNHAYNGGAVYIKNVTDSSYILNSVFIGNTASNLGGAVFIEAGIYYFISDSTRKTFNTTMRFNDLFDNNTLVYMEDVWVVKDVVVANGTYDDPTGFNDAFNKVSPFGTIHFKIANETYDYTSLGYLEKTCVKFNLTFAGNNTTIKGLTFICSEYATGVKIYNFIFSDYSGSPVIIWNGDNGMVVNCTFRNNGGDYVGNGSCLRINADNFNIINTTFINNTAGLVDSVGGAVYCNGTGLNIINSTFINNYVYDNGAHLYLSDESKSLNIYNSTFIGGSSIRGRNKGSGLYILGAGFSIGESEFKDNCGLYGGALYLNAGGSIKECIFFNNSATNGSAVYINKNGVSIVDSYFASPKFDEYNNIIPGYVYTTLALTLRNNTLSFTDLNKTVSEANSNLSLQYNYKYFEDYDSAFVGGVVVGKVLSIEGNDHLIDCSKNARAFYISANNVVVSNLTFVDGKAMTSTNRYLNGGAISVSGSGVNISYCSFDSCSAQHGSAVEVHSSNCRVSYCNFTNNRATSYDAALCFFESGTSGGVVEYCNFINNSAARWAAGIRADTPINIINCDFINNTGTTNGGGVFLGSGASNSNVSGCVFVLNSANYGGAVYNGGVSNTIFNGCSFIDNYALVNGGVLYMPKTTTLVDCVLLNNSAPTGSAIYITDVLTLTNTTFASPKFNETNNKLPGYIYSTSTVNYNNISLSFTDLSYIINNTGDILDLQFNYLYFNDYDQAFITGVPINKVLTINGNDKVINGNFTARIFNITSNTELINLNLVNGNASLGGAIYSIADLTLTNVTFINNTAVNGSSIYIIKTVNHWDNVTFKNNSAFNATVYFKDDSTVYSSNLTFKDNTPLNGLNIVGTDHIYSPVIYVDNSRVGFGIITDEATSLTRAVDNILPNGKIFILDDYDVESIIKFTNLNNITVVGNKTKLKDKYLFILPIIQKYIKKKQIVF